MKRIALLLLVISACKTSDSTPAKTDPPPAPVPTAAPHARTAPSLPGDPSANSEMGSGDRPSLPPEGTRPWRRGDRMAKMDKDGDGVISDDERAAAMKERADRMRGRLDKNGDGKLTPDEVSAAQGRMHFDDPAALDTNHDGDISSDELAAAMQARRAAMRDKRNNLDGSATEK